MEQVLEVYQQPYDPRYPLVNMDEQHKQLIEEVQTPWTTSPGAARGLRDLDVC